MTTTTVIEKSGPLTIYKADVEYEIPPVDLLTLLFETDHCSAKEDTLLHIDAANPSQSLNKSQARNLTKRIGHTLRHRYGIGSHHGKLDYVTCISAGNYILPTVFFGVAAAGGVFSSVSSSSTVPELARLIQSAPSDLVICSPETQDVAIQAAKVCGIPDDRVLVVDAPNVALREITSGKDVLGKDMMEWRRLSKEEAENIPVCLIYSSGTTGLPKGVPLSHRNMTAAAHISCGMIKSQMSFDYKTIAHLPVAHIAGMQGYFVNPMYMGGPTYWMPKFDFVQFLDYCERYKISFFFTVPPIYLLIAKSPAVTNQFRFLEYAISGAAPMGKELQEAASAKFKDGQTFITQTWGLSENTGSATLNNFGEIDLSGSVSRLLPNMKLRIVDDDGQDVEVGKEGELLLKGPIVFKGYHNNPDASKDAFDSEGYFRTGDVGLFRNGMFYIVDRKKELIKYKGMQVAPAELEAHLLSHPDILDAAVIGVDFEHTEAPRAYVVADRSRVSAEQIKLFVKEHMATYKQLRGGVVFVDAIPKSPSGKILRRDLRAMAKAETGSTKAKL
ncbi:hypothetical protein FKW77_005473 [Venturia effusa]|uniref:NRPS-like protein biosynthetic cluster n=1 Tax=Venturia effusa TaxID=50376 RepID=A0A517L1D5_9PEZI|nr:hypothetical protein FKW77_005473 [Venturia effusa]